MDIDESLVGKRSDEVGQREAICELRRQRLLVQTWVLVEVEVVVARVLDWHRPEGVRRSFERADNAWVNRDLNWNYHLVLGIVNQLHVQIYFVDANQSVIVRLNFDIVRNYSAKSSLGCEPNECHVWVFLIDRHFETAPCEVVMTQTTDVVAIAEVNTDLISELIIRLYRRNLTANR